MKTNLLKVLVLIIILFGSEIYAQKNGLDLKKGKIGVSFNTFSDNSILDNMNDVHYDGGSSCQASDYFYTLGVNYIYPVKKWLDFETGIDYTKQGILLEYDKITANGVIFYTNNTKRMSLINIPITYRANFLKFLFINGGATIEIDGSSNSSTSNQSGIGFVLGLGVKYDFKSGFSVFVNPLSKIHSLIPLISTKEHSRLIENSFRFGLTYNLNQLSK